MILCIPEKTHAYIDLDDEKSNAPPELLLAKRKLTYDSCKKTIIILVFSKTPAQSPL